MGLLNRVEKFLDQRARWIVIIAIVIYVAIFSFISLWKYYNFGYNGLDLAIINQVFYNSAQGNFFASSIHPPNYLGDHFTPILFLLLPFYFLLKNPQSLLILQTLALALTAWPIYLVSKKILDKKWALFMALAWLFNPFVQNINLFEFHFLPFATFFIVWIFYFYREKKFWPFLIFSSLALLVREDVAFVVVIFGLLAMIDRRQIKWWLTPILLSIVYFLLAVTLSSLASQTDQYKFLLYYSWLGNSWLEIIKNVALHPWILIPKIFSPGSIIVALGLLLPTAYLPLLKPKYLLLSSLIYLQLIMGTGWNWLAMILFTQYGSLLLPGIFLAMIFGVKKLYDLKFKDKALQSIFKQKGILMTIISIAVIYSTLIIGPLPGSIAKIARQGLISPEARAKGLILQQIPAGAAVATTYELLTPLSSRANIYSLNYVFLGKLQFLAQDYALPDEAEYLLIDYQDLVTYQLQYDRNDFYQNQYKIALAAWPEVLKNFGLVTIQDSLALYKKGTESKFNLVEYFNQAPEISFSKNLNSQALKFLGYNKINNHYQLFWQKNQLLEKNYYLKLTINNKTKKIYPLGYGLLNDEQHQDKKIIQTNYWFEFNDLTTGNNNKFTIDLIEIVSGGIEVDGVRSTKNVIDQQTTILSEILTEKVVIESN